MASVDSDSHTTMCEFLVCLFISDEFSVGHGNSSMQSWVDILRGYNVFFSVILFISVPYFHQLDAKSKDMYRHERICIGNTAHIN